MSLKENIMQQNVVNNDIVHDKESMRFSLTLDDHTGYVEYRMQEAYMDITHTCSGRD